MLRKSLAFSSLTAMLLLSGCSLGKKAVCCVGGAGDFAIVVDENHDTTRWRSIFSKSLPPMIPCRE